MADSSNPELVLSPEQFDLFREATLHALDKEPASSWPRFETSFCRGGVFIFVASNPEAEEWLTKTVVDLRPREGGNLKVSEVEILKATAWITRKPEDPAIVLWRLKGFNSSLKRASWRIVRHERHQEANATGGLKHLLIVHVPESQTRALAGLNGRPFNLLGQITFKVSGREQERPAPETERP